ncbi:2-polyprenyl-3-methyl-5-hydroxy-6-metoxy-1,4-benzoquinol methylase [Mucilaginibacter sp. UYNi724]
MANKYLDPGNKFSLNQKFREKRFKFFVEHLEKIKTDKPIRILDVGGMEIYWERMNYLDPAKIHITLYNLFENPASYNNITSVVGDATDLSRYADGEFDMVFSNSVIEHLYTKENQQKMADEIRRVGKSYHVQTPNYYFPIEPHWLFPMFQFLPKGLKVFLTTNFKLGHIGKLPKEKAIDVVNEVSLLKESEMKALFPDAQVYREKFAGLVKSITMYR